MNEKIYMKSINLDVEILGYGPELNLIDKGYGVLTPQQVIAMASQMTYKDKDARQMALEYLEECEKDINLDFDKKTEKTIMGSAGRGHASLTTSASLWVLIKNSSKIVDSALTGIVFGSSLMPSSRRIPVSVENIVVPEGISNADPELIALYYDVSSENIQLHEELRDKGVSTQDAAKITQYGIAGGGFMFLTLESILSYKRELEIEGKFIPKEIHNFVDLIESQLRDFGMEKLYWSRQHSPRNTYPYPHPFSDSDKNSFIQNLQGLHDISYDPFVMVNIPFGVSTEFVNDIADFLNFQEAVFSSEESIIENWKELELRRSDLVKRYEGMVSAESFANISWRVWGEVKRHRTVEQRVESVYAATNRALETFSNYSGRIQKGDLDSEMLHDFDRVLKTPKSISENNDYLREWLVRFDNSLKAYQTFVNRGIPESDAILIIPRGLMLNVHKRFNLFNIIDGYLPLRLCGTAEPEIQELSRKEAKLIGQLVPQLEGLIGPKCHTSGFCPESLKSHKGCKRINSVVGFYDDGVHRRIQRSRVNLIKSEFS